MKKNIGNLILTAALFLGFSSVSAATINVNMIDGTKKTYEIEESEYKNTFYDFKKSIEKDVGISADYQILENVKYNYPLNDELELGKYFSGSYGGDAEDIINLNLFELEELKGDTLNIYSIPPISKDMYYMFEEIFFKNYRGYNVGDCNDDATKCMIRIIYSDKKYKEMNMNYIYDKDTMKSVSTLLEKVKAASNVTEYGGYRFELNDLELINYWVNGGSIINYSDVYKKALDYKNFYIDVRAGDGDNELYTILFGMGYYNLDKTLYGAIDDIGVDTKHILYVPSDISDDKILSYLQDRIDNYVGKNIVSLSVVDDYDCIDRSNEININIIKDYSCDGKIYNAKVNGVNHYFVVGKDTSKMKSPKLITRDYKTGVTVSFTDGSKPLDTMVGIETLTSGKVYDKIMNILGVTNSETFDISLFANSTNKYITKLNDGTFEVRIPIKDELKNKDLIVYYVNDRGQKEEYKVTYDDNYAVFNTNHFSIYTLAEKNSSVKESVKQTSLDNPKTSDTIISTVIIGMLSILGIGVTIKLIKR